MVSWKESLHRLIIIYYGVEEIYKYQTKCYSHQKDVTHKTGIGLSRFPRMYIFVLFKISLCIPVCQIIHPEKCI